MKHNTSRQAGKHAVYFDFFFFRNQVKYIQFNLKHILNNTQACSYTVCVS